MAQSMRRDNMRSMPSLKDIHDFLFERFLEVKSMGDLVKFHSINKFLIMAHSPNQLNKLGNVVANHEGLKICKVLEKYHLELKKALDSKPTTKSHFNTLQHIMGHFSPDLSGAEKRYFLNVLGNFKDGKVPVSEALQILRDCTYKYENSYISRQTYFLFFTNPDMG